MSTKRQQRQKQHRPERDVKHARELADLRRENNRLARQNARFRKQAERATSTRDMFEGVDTSATVPVQPGGAITPAVLEDAAERCRKGFGAPQERFYPAGSCPECGTATRRLELGPKTLDVCPECKWRKVVA